MRRRAARGRCRDAPGPVADAGEVERLAADREARARVTQHGEAFRGQRRRHVAIVVVIAEHREHAVRRRQRRERVGRRLHEPPVAPGDVVAAEHDEVGRFRHEQVARRASIISCDTVSLRWTSVMRPMRSPASAAGRPDTGSVARVSSS